MSGDKARQTSRKRDNRREVQEQITNGPPAPAAYAASDPTGHELGGAVDRSDLNEESGVRTRSDRAGSEARNVK